MEKILMDVKEVCEYLNICETNVRKMAKNPNNKFIIRSGSKILFHKRLLDEHIERCAKYGIKI